MQLHEIVWHASPLRTFARWAGRDVIQELRAHSVYSVQRKELLPTAFPRSCFPRWQLKRVANIARHSHYYLYRSLSHSIVPPKLFFYVMLPVLAYILAFTLYIRRWYTLRSLVSHLISHSYVLNFIIPILFPTRDHFNGNSYGLVLDLPVETIYLLSLETRIFFYSKNIFVKLLNNE